MIVYYTSCIICNFSQGGCFITIRIKDAMKLPIMKETKLIAGKNGLDNQIKWVTVIEVVEDIDRLQKDEFLITTGFKLMEDKARLDSFQQLLKADLLSGVAIYTSFYMKEIPEAFIKLANKHHLPLIEIPVDINFSEITKEVLELIVNRQANLLAHSENTHHELSRLILNDKSLTEVTKRLAQLTSSKIVIYNEFYEIIYLNEAYYKEDDSYFEKTMLQHNQQEIEISGYLLNSLEKETRKNIPFAGNIMTITPIIAKQSCFGWIVMWKDKDNWKEIDEIACARASTIYAMEFLKKQAIEETQLRIQSNLLEDIFNRNYTHERVIIDQASKLNYDLTLTQCVFHIAFKHPETTDIHLVDRLYQTIESLLLQKNKQHIIQTKLQAIVFITNVTGDNKDTCYRHVVQLAEEIQKEWEYYFPNNELIIGIGKCCNELAQLANSANEASYAAVLYPLICENRNIMHYLDLGMYDILLKMRKNGIDLPSIYEESMSNLYDENEREIDLINTISTYFKNNQSIQKSSEKLFIHRHTLRYRLKQIEQKTGLSFKNTDDLLKLQLGVMAYKLAIMLDGENDLVEKQASSILPNH